MSKLQIQHIDAHRPHWGPTQSPCASCKAWAPVPLVCGQDTSGHGGMSLDFGKQHGFRNEINSCDQLLNLIAILELFAQSPCGMAGMETRMHIHQKVRTRKHVWYWQFSCNKCGCDWLLQPKHAVFKCSYCNVNRAGARSPGKRMLCVLRILSLAGKSGTRTSWASLLEQAEGHLSLIVCSFVCLFLFETANPLSTVHSRQHKGRRAMETNKSMFRHV